MAEGLPAIPAHQWTDESRKVLVLKQLGPNRTTRNNFKWPMSGPVEAPDWNPVARCGGGLHAWPWGLAFGDGCDPNYKADFCVIAVDPQDVIGLDGKCKFRAGEVILSGSYLECHLKILAGQIKWTQQSGAASSTGDKGAASSTGTRGAASSTGDQGAASSTGDQGAASSTGTRGAASSTGNRGAASSTGDKGAASSTGTRGAASSTGDQGAASSTGYQGAASSTGDQGAASSTGDQGAASSTGDQGAASSTGYRGAASSTGDQGAAVVTGKNSLVECGPTGLAVSTASPVWWTVRPGAVLVQRVGDVVHVLDANNFHINDGEVVGVENGVIWREWERPLW